MRECVWGKQTPGWRLSGPTVLPVKFLHRLPTLSCHSSSEGRVKWMQRGGRVGEEQSRHSAPFAPSSLWWNKWVRKQETVPNVAAAGDFSFWFIFFIFFWNEDDCRRLQRRRRDFQSEQRRYEAMSGSTEAAKGRVGRGRGGVIRSTPRM